MASLEDLTRDSSPEQEKVLLGIVTDDDTQDAAIARAARLCASVREYLGAAAKKVVRKLLIADNLSVAFKAEKDGKMIARSTGWSDNEVFLPGQAMQVTVEGGRLVFTKVQA